MTTPTRPQLRPSPPYRYQQISQLRLTLAAEELDKGDLAQASEKIWGATAAALKAVAQQRGWNHRYHNHLRSAAAYLALEWNRPDWDTTFGAMDSLHTNFYEPQLYETPLRNHLDAAVTYCRELWHVRQAAPPRQEALTPSQQADQERFLRTLTRPLTGAAAFGDEFTDAELAELPPVEPGG